MSTSMKGKKLDSPLEKELQTLKKRVAAMLLYIYEEF